MKHYVVNTTACADCMSKSPIAFKSDINDTLAHKIKINP